VHVFPEDVERVVEGVAGVREAAVVGRTNGGERVHAVLVLGPEADATAIIRQANAKLESHQRIRDFSVWPGQALPRTEAIRKLKREEIRRWVAEGARQIPSATPAGTGDVETILARYTHGKGVSPDTTLDELGLTSLDRIELTMALEEQTGVGLSEASVAASQTIGDLRRAIDEASTAGPIQGPLSFPRWTRRLWARTIRDVSQPLWILPLASIFMRRRITGLEHLDQVRGPVIFAANHQSHFDTPAILSTLPPKWRRYLAVTMAKDFFDAHFAPSSHTAGDRLKIGALYYLAVLFFNAFPLPRTGPGTRDTLRYAGELVAAGFSILVFPEGHRTEHGEIGHFQPGVGMMASKLRLPVVPVRLEGLERVLHHTWRWPRRGPVRISFGPHLELEGDDYPALAQRVEQAVTALLPERVQSARPDAA
jgi:long-chain acyl-CoA synthetase